MGGVFPDGLQFLPALQSLVVEYGNLDGSIPGSAVAQLTNLKTLSVRHNKFRGAIPVALLTLKNLQQLDLSHNSFEGALPAGLHTLPLETLDLSHNQFTGTIADSLGASTTLTALRLNGNAFVGNIPSMVCDLALPLLETDCSPSALGGGEITCGCCTGCCNSSGEQCTPTTQ